MLASGQTSPSVLVDVYQATVRCDSAQTLLKSKGN